MHNILVKFNYNNDSSNNKINYFITGIFTNERVNGSECTQYIYTFSTMMFSGYFFYLKQNDL